MPTVSKQDFQRLALLHVRREPIKRRKKVGKGDLRLYKAWQAEMCRLEGLFLPIRIVSEANTRGHWRVRYKRFKAQEAMIETSGRNYLRPFKLPVRVTLVRYGKKILDDDNLAGGFKKCRDVIAKMLGCDDGDKNRIRFVYEDHKAKFYGIRILIEVEHGN